MYIIVRYGLCLAIVHVGVRHAGVSEFNSALVSKFHATLLGSLGDGGLHSQTGSRGIKIKDKIPSPKKNKTNSHLFANESDVFNYLELRN